MFLTPAAVKVCFVSSSVSALLACSQVYREALANPACVAVHMTHIDADMDCDTHLQGFDPATWRQWSATPVRKHKDLAFSYHCYVRAGTGSFTQAPKGMNSRHEESQANSRTLPCCMPDTLIGHSYSSSLACSSQAPARHRHLYHTATLLQHTAMASQPITLSQSCSASRSVVSLSA